MKKMLSIAGLSISLLALASGSLNAQTCGTSLSCSSNSAGFFVSNSGGEAIQGTGTGAGATGVLGTATTASGIGVEGTATGTGTAIYGYSPSGYAVTGQSGAGNPAISGFNTSISTLPGAGVQGSCSSSGKNANGVLGYDGNGRAHGYTGNFFSAGVRGESVNGYGVFGLSNKYGVVGNLNDVNTGAIVTYGVLGASNLTANGRTQNWAVYAFGDIGATGVKYFIEPHPTDAGKVIKYIALEGPEAGTYFRGTAKTHHGEARIQVPEDFRMVTAEEGMTVQLTPVGALATMAVMKEDLSEIVVRSSEDVTFHFLVHGIRRSSTGYQPITREDEFMPRSADDKIPASLNEEIKRRLIANGTYNEDGTVNMQTAERLGWTKVWAEAKQK